jgi:hypothetical protein
MNADAHRPADQRDPHLSADEWQAFNRPLVAALQNDSFPDMPRTIGYHLFKSAYGLWLPGNDRGSWSESPSGDRPCS